MIDFDTISIVLGSSEQETYITDRSDRLQHKARKASCYDQPGKQNYGRQQLSLAAMQK